MQGNSQVLQELNTLLVRELTAADQYFVHSQMYENWGFYVLYARMSHEWQEELLHATRLIKRILFLGGTPDVASRAALQVGREVPEMLKNDLNYELVVISSLKKAISVCEKEQDYETRQLLVELLKDSEEDHAHWLEVQLELLGKLGLENYLQSASQLAPKSNKEST